jgi:hypothetical protein
LFHTNEEEVIKPSRDFSITFYTCNTSSNAGASIAAAYNQSVKPLNASIRGANAVSKGDQIQFLLQINDESKVRRLANVHILGRREKVIVMGSDELEEAQAKRTE